MKAEGLLAIKRLGNESKGEITVISDAEDNLKRLKSAFPQPTTHILDWFHIAIKLHPIELTAEFVARRMPSDERGANLRVYIEQNRGSIANCGARYREGIRIATTSAEASVYNLVAKRMVKKQQMRWSESGANLLLQVRVAVANGDLAEPLAYQPPIQPRQIIISPFVPVPLFQRAV